MLQNLANKRLLFLAPNFFGYEDEIKQELEKHGALVDVLIDRPFRSSVMKGLTTISPQVVTRLVNARYQKKLEDYGRSHYDFIFVINGQTLSPQVLSQWRHAFPRAQFVLYIWDSIKNRPHLQKNLAFFDYCFTFDKKDANYFKLRFHPLFFSKGFENSAPQVIQYDLSFIGTAHTNRYLAVSTLAQSLPSHVRFYHYLYLQARWVYYYYKVRNPTFKASTIKEFYFSPLAKELVHQVFLESRAILDIEHPSQTGLTMRTLESLGARKKLITTNKNIVEYDFFDPHNILILDSENPIIPSEFFNDPYKKVSSEVYQKYSINNWLSRIMHPVT